MTRNDSSTSGWVAIIAARMPRAASQRVRASRRLRQTGAVAVRPGVYALPDSAGGREALASAALGVARQRGSALPCVLTWLDSGDEAKLRIRYEQERNRRRQRLLKHIHNLERTLTPGSRLNATSRRTVPARLARLRKHLDRASPAAAPAAAWEPDEGSRPAPLTASGATPYRGRTWVTRRGVLVDRIASAWLIQRFIDHAAQFRFVSPGEPSVPGELRFASWRKPFMTWISKTASTGGPKRRAWHSSSPGWRPANRTMSRGSARDEGCSIVSMPRCDRDRRRDCRKERCREMDHA